MYIFRGTHHEPADSLWEALSLPKTRTKATIKIAAAGSGGKTSLLYALAREGQRLGYSVLLLPTTHMEVPASDGVLTGRAEDVVRKLSSDGFAVAGLPAAPSPGGPACAKISFPGWEIYEKAGAAADLVLIEADGSRRMPLKAPNADEPVIPPDVQLILTVTGMSALGKKPEDVCHRLPAARAILEKPDWNYVTLQDLCLLQKKGYLLPLRQQHPHSTVLPVWNQADTPELQSAARRALSGMGERDGLILSLIP